MNDLNTMLSQAKSMLERAYAPYSNFSVSCTIKSASGQTYSGCNIENAAYGLTLCAEGSAIANMVTAGEQEIAEVVVMAKSIEVCAPCGSCRQRINEFANRDVKVHLCNPEGIRKTMTLGELLPESFGPETLATK